MSDSLLTWVEEESGEGWSFSLGVPDRATVGDEAIDPDIEGLFHDGSDDAKEEETAEKELERSDIVGTGAPTNLGSDSDSDFSLDETGAFNSGDEMKTDLAAKSHSSIPGNGVNVYGTKADKAEETDSSKAELTTWGKNEQEEGVNKGAEDDRSEYDLRPKLLIRRLWAGTLSHRDKAGIEQLLRLVEEHGLPGHTITTTTSGTITDGNGPAKESSATADEGLTPASNPAVLPTVNIAATAASPEAVQSPITAKSSSSSSATKKTRKRGEGTTSAQKGRQWTVEEDELGKVMLWSLTDAGVYTEGRFAQVAAVLRQNGFDRDAISVRNRARRAWRFQDGRDDRRPRSDGRPRELITSARKKKKEEMLGARREEGTEEAGEAKGKGKREMERDAGDPEELDEDESSNDLPPTKRTRAAS